MVKLEVKVTGLRDREADPARGGSYS